MRLLSAAVFSQFLLVVALHRPAVQWTAEELEATRPSSQPVPDVPVARRTVPEGVSSLETRPDETTLDFHRELSAAVPSGVVPADVTVAAGSTGSTLSTDCPVCPDDSKVE